ncbi:hypothetical protein JVT61DRAFT_7307 [Boletus reticuloceps]|uniref:Uncharacterized protein n=1 Tax=Boletus reticuloceps TaxID=495285 RepID=A0A8I2YJL5_9AGAM|nr:hypothetical protein JVT61DRAFT_7307 [Boletus reticuloceps]
MGMCKMYNLTVESLSYKWQALSYSTTNTLAVFSPRSVPDLKAKLQQELNLRSAAGRGRGRVSGIGEEP